MKTNFLCTSMTLLDSGKLKATASVTINNGLVINGLKVYDGRYGLCVFMPSQKVDEKYRDIVFPSASQARKDISTEVLRTYNELVASERNRFVKKLRETDNVQEMTLVSKLKLSPGSDEVKASGEIIINNCFVITDVKVVCVNDEDGMEIPYVLMPWYEYREDVCNYVDFASESARRSVEKSVLSEFDILRGIQREGIPYNHLKLRGSTFTVRGIENGFAKKLMKNLDANRIRYSAAMTQNTSDISLNVKNRELFEAIRDQVAIKSCELKHAG